jgi:aminoglycoside 3-N-acetyltransferase
MTFYHHVEEIHQVDYRIPKQLTAPYFDSQNRMSKAAISLYVRDLDNGISTLLDPVADLMWKKNLYSGDKFNEGMGLRVISANKMYSFVSHLIKQNKTKGFLYETK